MSYAAVPLDLSAHREALAALWTENMSDAGIAATVPRRMHWLYEDGPEGPPTTVLALHVESNAVVGCGSLFRRAIWVDGERLLAGVLCEFAVTRAHRTAGAALTIQRALIEAARSSGLHLLYGFPNEKSVAVFKRVGYRVVAEATRWVKPLGAAYKLRQVRALRAVAPLLAAPIDLGLGALDLLRTARVGRVTGTDLADPSLELRELWERSGRKDGVIGERSWGYLDWRYLRYPTAEHQVFGITRPGETSLCGYAMYVVSDGKAFVRDLFVEPGRSTAEALLLTLARHLRRRRVDSMSLSYVGPHSFGARLRALGFLPRPGTRSLILHAAEVAEARRARLLDPSSWLMLDGELDL